MTNSLKKTKTKQTNTTNVDVNQTLTDKERP